MTPAKYGEYIVGLSIRGCRVQRVNQLRRLLGTKEYSDTTNWCDGRSHTEDRHGHAMTPGLSIPSDLGCTMDDAEHEEVVLCNHLLDLPQGHGQTAGVWGHYDRRRRSARRYDDDLFYEQKLPALNYGMG